MPPANRNTRRSAVSDLSSRRGYPNGVDCPSPCAAAAGASRDGLCSRWGVSTQKGPRTVAVRLVKGRAQVCRLALEIVGSPEDGHDNELRALAAALGLPRFHHGPNLRRSKNRRFRAADLFVLPSLNENFGLTIAEALAAGTPAISTKARPGRARARRLRLVDRHGVEPLVTALAQAMTLPRDALKAMGDKGRNGWCGIFLGPRRR